EVPQVEFSRDDAKEVQLLSVGLTDERGAQVDAPIRDRPFAIRVRFLVRREAGGVDVGVWLTTRNGTRAREESGPAMAQGRAPGVAVEDADSAVLCAGRDVDELDMAIAAPDLVPEAVDLAQRILRVREDVVERDRAPVSHERRVHLEVLPYAFVGVVAVDHQE